MLKKIVSGIFWLLLFQQGVFAMNIIEKKRKPITVLQPSDTSKILPMVQITGLRYASFFVGNKFSVIDSNILNQYQQNNLAQLLSDQSQIFIKSYSPSMLASPGFRGGNANHTPVLWNGFNLQSITNGQTDLSLIPSFLMEGIAIQYGSPATLFGSGAIGGSIHLQSVAPLQNGLKGELLLGASSYQTYTQGIKLFYRNKNWQTTQKIFKQNSENNFEYKNIDLLQNTYRFNTPNYSLAKTESAKNAAWSTLAWVQEISYTPNSKSSFMLRSWFQSNERGIPPALNLPANYASQQDACKRINTEYKYKNALYELNIRYALLDDFLKYFDSTINESTSKSQSHIIYADQFYHTSNSYFQLSFMDQKNVARSSSYSGFIQQNKMAIFGSYKWLWLNQKLQQQISFRQEWVEGKPIPLMPSYGVQYEINPIFSISGNAARSYRLPTFNDLFWTPGGNPNLLPESGWNEEISLKAKMSTSKKIGAQVCLTAFNKNVDNWIIWLPNSVSGVSPYNLNKVWSRGLEADWKLNILLNKWSFLVNGLHDFTLATNQSQSTLNQVNTETDMQLIYIPRVKHILQLGVYFKGYSATYQNQYIGTRFVSADNQSWLNPYQTARISFGKFIQIKQNSIQLQMQINNVFNQTYQVMLNRPMPLRNYQISIQYKF